MMQFHKVMYPVFARLGVKLITRNIGMGGLGTAHNAMGSGSIYGSEVDILMWDSGMFLSCFVLVNAMMTSNKKICGRRFLMKVSTSDLCCWLFFLLNSKFVFTTKR